jgi:SAM-dependent methyltransferase
MQKHVALRLLSLSPHYFYNRDIRAEAERNRRSRQALADALIVPHLNRATRVIDYGCGPGFMAYAVAGQAGHVDAVDISRGVLACARALNGRANITYLRPDELERRKEMADLAYSFAVVQHLTSEVLIDVLGLLASKIRQNGLLLLHFPVPDQGGWHTEAELMARQSIADRAKLRYGLNCFGRTVADMEGLVASSGFTDVVIRPLSGRINVPGDDDIVKQHILIARRQ